MRLAERVILVFGDAGPVHRCIAARLTEEGAAVALASADATRGARIQTELEAGGATCSFLAIESLDAAAARGCVGEVVLDFGAIDGLVVCGTTPPRGDAVEVDEAAWNRSLAEHLRAPWLVVSAALPFLKKSVGASVVVVTSTDGMATEPRSLLSATIAAGQGGLVRTLAIDGGPHDIRVNAVAAGYIETEESRRRLEGAADPAASFEREMAVQPLGRFGRPRDVANAVLFLLSEESSYVTGATLVVDGGRHAVARDLYG
ncbi:MAG: SDR family oxidoreductase [Planctomycetota bacterium]